MKNVCIIFLLSIIISLSAVGLFAYPTFSQNEGGRYETNEEYLRIHIRADSNQREAQAVKYAVKEELVRYLTPLVANYPTKQEAARGLATHLDEIAATASAVLQQHGFFYGATAELTVENFPTRVYSEYTLPAGAYTALIVRLGRGEGDNWWCVVYPPLCFTSSNTNIVYRSKIAEIIKSWKEKIE